MRVSCKVPLPGFFRISCGEESQAKNRREKVKLIKSNGDVDFYDRPIKAVELMKQFPKHMVCRSDSFYIGQKTPFLSREDKLKPGNYYFLLPNQFFQSALSFATLNRSRTALFGNKSPFEVVRTSSGNVRIKVCEEMIVRHHQEFVLEENGGRVLDNPHLRREYEILVGKRRLWKPKLDTIKEEKTKKKKN